MLLANDRFRTVGADRGLNGMAWQGMKSSAVHQNQSQALIYIVYIHSLTRTSAANKYKYTHKYCISYEQVSHKQSMDYRPTNQSPTKDGATETAGAHW